MHPFKSEHHRGQTGTEQSLVRRIIDRLYDLGSNHYGRVFPGVPDETERDRSRRIADKAQDMIDFFYAEYPGVAPRPRPPTVSPTDEVLVTVNNLAADQGVTLTHETDADGSITINVSGGGVSSKFVRNGNLKFGSDRIYTVIDDNVSPQPLLELTRGPIPIMDLTKPSAEERAQLAAALRWYATVIEKEDA